MRPEGTRKLNWSKKGTLVTQRKAGTPRRPTLRGVDHGLLPPSADRFIKPHEGVQDVALGLCEFLFRGQALSLRIQHFQIAADAAHISHVCQSALIAQRISQQLLTTAV